MQILFFEVLKFVSNTIYFKDIEKKQEIKELKKYKSR